MKWPKPAMQIYRYYEVKAETIETPKFFYLPKMPE